MKATVESLDFKPPQAGRWSMPLGLAFVTHGLLIAALTWGVHWQQDPQPVAFEAELWSPTVSRAAPAAVQPPPPPPEPEVQPEPRPVPKAEPRSEPRAEPPAPPKAKAPDIAIEQARKKQQEKDRQQRELVAQEMKKKEQAREEAKRERAEQAKKLAENKKKQDAEQKKLADAKRKDDARKAAEADARAERELQANREANLRRIMGQAGATGSPAASGSAQRDSGPSAGYAGRVQARIRPNIIYQADFPPTLRTEVEVRASADGNITSRRVVRSSGNAEWDQAALRAIDRTGVLPRDTDGSVPSPINVTILPRD